jgi:hypothetical protein
VATRVQYSVFAEIVKFIVRTGSFASFLGGTALIVWPVTRLCWLKDMSRAHVTNKYLQATTKSKRLAQAKLVDAILPGGVLSGSKSNLIH